MNAEQILDKDTYRSIKKMTRAEMLDFLTRYGDHLLEDEGKVIDLPALEKELSKINGIGKKRLEEIMVVIEKFLGV